MSFDHNELDPIGDSAMRELQLLELLDDVKGRIGEERTELETPPPEVWVGLRRQLEADLQADVTNPSPTLSQTALSQTDNVVTSLDHHRQKRRPAGLLLAGVAASVVAALVLGSVLRDDSRIVGEVELAALNEGGPPVLGTATIVEENDVTRLDIEFETGLTGSEDSFELWIIDSNIDQMYSLGEIGSTGSGDQRSYQIPQGVDIQNFPIVDISLEPDDGDPTHSGNSHFRGVLDA